MRTFIGSILALVFAAAVSAQETKPEIVFLDKTAGGAAILDDKAEPYFDTLQSAEMSTKTGAPITGDKLAEQRAECRKRYQAAVLDFSDDEKAVLRWCIEKIHPIVQADYPLYAKVPWSFIKVGDSIEGGFPHTRGAHIVMSEGVLSEYVQMKAKMPEAAALVNVAQTLLHEKLHVFQRKNPQLMAKLYTSVWGFEHADKIDGCDWLVARHLANPDGLDTGWIFPIKDGEKIRYIWPLVVLAGTDQNQRMGPDFREIGIDLQKNDKGYSVVVADDKSPASKPLDKIPEYMAKFGHSGENFHPNEISAEWFAMIVCLDSLIPNGEAAKQRDALEKDLAPMRKWLRENMK